MSHKWMKNDETGGVWAVPDALLEHYERRGWVETTDPDEDIPEASPQPKRGKNQPIVGATDKQDKE